MIRLRGLTFTYPGAPAPALRGLDLDLPEGALCLVTGPTGCGKSTLLRALCGLVPHHSGGTFAGRLEIAGRDRTGARPRELAGLVGFVPQDPEAHATADRVVPELAFAMENLGVPPVRMRKRIEELLDLLGLAHLRERRLDALSGGERQRVAIAAVLGIQPKVLILDEPTSCLDPQSAEDVFSALVRLRDELGLTVVVSEHRLERVAGFADWMCWLPGPGGGAEPAALPDPGPPICGPPREVLRAMPYVPPVTRLGLALGWEPLPLTVREGRAFARGLRPPPPPPPPPAPAGPAVLSAAGLRFAHDGTEVLRGVSFDLRPGEVCALVGRNGAGKTTLLRALVGLARPGGGRITLDGRPLEGVRQAAERVAYLPQRADALLYRETVGSELEAAGIRDDPFGLRPLAARHPWTLSAGQRLRLALAITLARRRDVLLADEPTRGLDPLDKQRLADLLAAEARRGAAVLLVTHDVELVARAAGRVALMAEGEVVAEGPTREVLGESLLFSTQTSKVMDDPRFLVPEDVIGR